MSADVSKIGYGVIVGAATNSGIVLSKIGYGVIVGPPSGVTAIRRRNFMSFST